MNEAILESPVPRIGRLVRLFRERRNKSQGEIAGASGISVSMLSQIERGVVSPSIDTLHAVCVALAVDIAELFRRAVPLSPVRIRRTGTRLRTTTEELDIEQLAVSGDGGFPAEMLLLELKPSGRIGLAGQGHEGVEMGYVLSGSATLDINGESYRIEGGDSITFTAHLPHRIVNDSPRPFVAVWNVLPPHRDYLTARVDEDTGG